PPPKSSCTASTAPLCCGTPPPSSPMAENSAWGRKSASAPARCTRAGRSAPSSSPLSNMWCAAPARPVLEASENSMTHQGGCHCGKIAYEFEGEIGAVVDCNCSLCQKRGGLL